MKDQVSTLEERGEDLWADYFRKVRAGVRSSPTPDNVPYSLTDMNDYAVIYIKVGGNQIWGHFCPIEFT